MAYDATGKTPQQLVADRTRAKQDPFYLAEVLGYDFQQDVHAELFEQMPVAKPGAALKDFSPDKNKLILWPRGHFKTTATVVRIIQIILNMPDVRILLMSANIKLTKNWLAEIRSHFSGKNARSGLLALFGDKWRTVRGNSLGFTVATRERVHLKDPTVGVATPKAVATGAHCDFFFADDLVNTSNYRNIELQDKLEEDFSNFVPLLDPGGYTVVTGTRYSGFDVYGRMIKKADKWKFSVKESRTADRVLLFPERVLSDGRKIGLTNDFLDGIEKDDPVMYNAQYMNRIVAINRQMFPRDLILSCVRSRKDQRFPANSFCYFAVDLAEEKNADSDNSVIVIARRDSSGRTWIEDVIGDTWTPSQLATVLLNLVLKYRPAAIFIEKVMGAITFKALVDVLAIEHNIDVRIDIIPMSNAKGAKYIKIGFLESKFKQGKLFLCSSIRDFEKLEEEFVDFPKGRHDDRPDAIATLVNHLNTVAPILPQNRVIMRGPMIGAPGEEQQQSVSAGERIMGAGWVC